MKMRRLSPLALAAALVATSGTVMFASPSQATTIGIRYSDLDLSTAGGRTALNTRIDRAVHVVCSVENSSLNEAANCRRESAANARQQMHRAMQDQAVQLAAR
jgi:UrcA family protein